MGRPVILKNGVKCLNCSQISYKNKQLIFNIIGAGAYTSKDSSALTTQEKTPTNQTGNQSTGYLPPIPEKEQYDAVGKAGNTAKEWWEKVSGLSNMMKIIILAGIILGIWWWKNRR